MIYGTPGLRLVRDVTDRIGIRTVIYSLLWEASRANLSLDELTAEGPGIPEMPGGLVLIGNQTQPAGGALRTTWTFEGVRGDGKSVTFKGRDNSNDYEFQPGFAQVDIKLHPDADELIDRYQGYPDADGKIIWPRKLTAEGGSGIGLGYNNSQNDTEGESNPLFGVEDFLRLEGTYTCRYAAFDIGGAQQGVGKVHTSGSLPGRAPTFSDRDWLKAPTLFQRRGPVFELGELYYLSGPGGWPPIYGQKR